MGDKQYLRIQVPEFISEGTASCASESVDSELFFPVDVEDRTGKVTSSYKNLRAAKEVCSKCPLSLKCLEYAITSYDSGIWGGTTEEQRTNIRRKVSRDRSRIQLKR
jgi:WhiB family redox-sensing transcriptional regulator